MKIGLGYIIKKYREAHNYDQASLARLAGISRGQVVYIENDKSIQLCAAVKSVCQDVQRTSP